MIIISITFHFKDWGCPLKIKEKNFHTGHDVNIPIYIDDRFLCNGLVATSPIITNLIDELFRNNDYDKVNPQLCLLGIASIIEVLNSRIINIQNRFNDIQYRLKNFIPLNSVSTQEYMDFNIELEQIIHIIKRVIDELITMFCITHDLRDTIKTNKIKFYSIGDMKRPFKDEEKPREIYKELRKQIRRSINYKNFEPFLTAVNDLHNAYKHGINNVQSRNIVGAYELTAHALHAPYENLNKTAYINCSFTQIIAGFNEFLIDITDIEKFSGKHIYKESEQLSLLN